MATPLIHEPGVNGDERQITRRQLHIVATVNGPGEVAAWLYPFAHALRTLHPDATLTAALLPCRFASGREVAVIDGMPNVDHVLSPEESLRWLVRGESPAIDTDPDMVLHFGGELGLSIALGRRLGIPVVAYEEERVRHAQWLDRVFVRDSRAAAGKEGQRVRVVGNLMVDAARLRVPTRACNALDIPSIAFFAGSRPYFIRQLLPLFLRVAHALQQRRPEVRFVLAKSDFISMDDIRGALSDRDDRVVEGDDGVVHQEGARRFIRSERGIVMTIHSPEAAMREAQLAVTIPGTNTAELGALGIPMLLVLPTYRLHALPLPGLAGHLGEIPVLGPLIKEMVARAIVRGRRFWAHPNRLANEAIVPEMVGRLTADAIAERLYRMLTEPLLPTEYRLRRAMGEPGASTRLVREVVSLVGERR